jgi:uncharacterized protein (TIGR03435 family)
MLNGSAPHGDSDCKVRFAYKFPNKVNPTSVNYLASLPALAVFLVASQVCFAQPQFEVASIKRNVSPDRNSTWRTTPGGRFTGENINLVFLLMTAYKIRDSQVSGAPGWFESEKYDILAKGEGNPNPDQLMKMLQALLLDRFKLKYHWIAKQLPVYALVPAKNGIKLKESKEGSCQDAGPDQKQAPPDQPQQAWCGTYFSRRNQLEGTRITMAQFIAALEFQLDRPVIDKTRLTVPFDVHLEWTPEETAADGPTDIPGPSIFTAVQEQLGLKLESQKGPVNTLVIDYIEKPGEN